MSDLIKDFETTRLNTNQICAPLELEDYVVQAAPFVSPVKWHLAHTSWFFEEFLLKKSPHYKAYNDQFFFIFNSYYKTCGKHWVQGERGHLSRPTVKEILSYRDHINHEIIQLINAGLSERDEIILKIGLEHEKQHQELLYMDIKYNLAQHPFQVRYFQEPTVKYKESTPLEFINHQEKIIELGQNYQEGICFDNETPKHKQLVRDFKISDRLITNKEYLQFIEDQGYQNPHLWFSDGLNWVQQESIEHPLYWSKVDGQYFNFTLHGYEEVDMHAPVSHISFYEASAFCEWAGYRLPTEFEWESFAIENQIRLNERWQWCSNSYEAYPGYDRPAGALGEYNQKFMCNQKVLRGGCHYTSENHIRYTYRNFYYPDQRWMFSGFRVIKK